MNREEYSFKFWNEIFDERWIDNPTDVKEFVFEKVKGKCGVREYDDQLDMIAVFNICSIIAGRIASNACVSWNITPIFDGHVRWKYLAFGWGDPNVTSDYYYIYFDFDNEMVFIDTYSKGRGENFTDLCDFKELFKSLYL